MLNHKHLSLASNPVYRFRLRNKIKLIKIIFVSDSTDLIASNSGLFKIKPSVAYSTELDVKTSGENENQSR